MSETDTKTPETKEAKDTKVEVQETEKVAAIPTSTEQPPPKPARPVPPQQKIINELQQAFPNVEEKYIKMALIASRGELDPAFNALLYLSDPNSDIQIPVPVPQDISKPDLPSRESSEKRRQLESDEALARRLAREFETGKTHQHRPKKQPPPRPAKKPQNWKGYDSSDEGDEDFVDTLAKNVEEARVKMGGWLGNIAKKLQDTTDSTQDSTQEQQQSQQKKAGGPTQLFSAFGGAKGNSGRNSLDHSRTAGSQQSGIRLTNHETEEDLYGTPTNTAKASGVPPTVPPKDVPSPSVNVQAEVDKKVDTHTKDEVKDKSKGGKWEPLSTVNPDPISDGTFLVDDSDDDDDEPVASAKVEKK